VEDEKLLNAQVSSILTCLLITTSRCLQRCEVVQGGAHTMLVDRALSVARHVECHNSDLPSIEFPSITIVTVAVGMRNWIRLCC
jgi:hypothetical protein